jgi:Fe-Mn family superoxide dismutase
MPFTLPALPYAPTALEASIDAQTMEIHHGKHHNAYVTNLNAAVEKAPELASWDLDKLCRDIAKVPESVRAAVRNNGGGHWNHSMFWTLMVPKSGGAPSGNLANAINAAFGDFAKFRDAFRAAAVGRFGSGWAWLVAAKDGKVSIESTPNQDNPLMEGKHAVLGLDVWEHAYYLRYRNRRPEYLANWWKVVDWTAVTDRFNAAKAKLA